MAKYTEKYNFGYFEPGDTTETVGIESYRWRVIDAQMDALFNVLGDGVISGWDFVVNDFDEFVLSITPGSGHISNVAVESTDTETLTLPANTKSYIYAISSDESFYTKGVTFTASTNDSEGEGYLLLGFATTDEVGQSPAITEVNIDDRVYISFKQQILDLINDHRHIGGTENPSKIDLETDVQGFLRSDNIEDLDASFIATGTIDPDRLPKIDHITKLSHVGVLTHSQLDTFVQILSQTGARLMGDVSSTDLLKMILAVKHVYPTIDEFLINELAFIPGISAETLVDKVNTTAVVDYRTAAQGGLHTIKGTPASSTSTFTKKWETDTEFTDTTRDDTAVVGDSVKLVARENKVFVEDFQDISDWETITTDLSSISSSFSLDSVLSQTGTTSGKLDINNDGVEVALILRKTFGAQDWSSYDKLVFNLYSPSAEHGDIYFYIYDAASGSQDSYQIVLERNSPTINRDSLAVGWREIVVDISSYSRGSITTIGLYTATSTGWEINQPFSFNVDNMFLTSGNLFVDRGTCIFRYGNDFEYTFSTVRWDASVPENTFVRVRTKVSDSESMAGAVWSDFINTSGGSITLPSQTSYNYIDVEVTLEADSTLKLTPQLHALYLDSTVTSTDYSFEFDAKDDWDAGELYNIDTETNAGSITIDNIGDIGTYLYGKDGSLKQLNSDLTEKLSILGTTVPKSFVQLSAGTVAGFGQISSVISGLNDSFIVADTDNDRVLELDKSGNVIWGLMGTFIETPTNPYLAAETVDDDTATTADDTTDAEAVSAAFNPIGSYYNVDDSALYVMFDKYLENVYTSETFDPSGMFLKSGARRIYFDKTNFTFSVVGADSEHIGESASSTEFSGANVLKVVIPEADAVTLSGAAVTQDPYLTMVTPTLNKVVTSSTLAVEFKAYNVDIGLTDYGIRYQIDSLPNVDLRTGLTATITGLADGVHTITAVLIDSNGNELSAVGTSLVVKIYVETGVLTETVVSIQSPIENQILSSGSFSVAYTTNNIPSGYTLRYSIDSGTGIEYSGSSPIALTGVASGSHTVKLYLADSLNVELAGSVASATATFVVVSRASVSFSLYVDKGSVKDSDGNDVIEQSISIDITKIRPANIYAPIDINIVTRDDVQGDASEFDLLVAKSGTPSNLDYKDTSYKDGHSVVQFTSLGIVRLSDNTAIIADTKDNAKANLGSAQKYSDTELFIADPYGKRAAVIKLDTTEMTSSVLWQYDSDKLVSDFNRIPDPSAVINVNTASLASIEDYLRRDSVVTWYNNTNDTVRILSGTTTSAQFDLDPDFDLFGDEFDSEEILPGEFFSHRFINFGTFNYFVHPFIHVGKIHVINTSITPDDNFIIAENDPSGSSYLNRVIKIDAWGNIVWSFGESFVSTIKGAKPTSSGEIIITV
jgi:hypothetical protein